MADDEDRKLVTAAREGDPDAFGRLAERYAGPIYNLALRVVGHGDDAMDVTQAAFVKAFEGAASAFQFHFDERIPRDLV